MNTSEAMDSSESPSFLRPSHGSWCSAPFCRNSRRKCPTLSFFSFPKEANRCRQWVLNVGRTDLLERTPEYLYRNCCLCANHFEDDQFMHAPSRSRLIWNAIPTLFERESLAEQLPCTRTSSDQFKRTTLNPVVVLEDCMISPPQMRKRKKQNEEPSTKRRSKIMKLDSEDLLRNRDVCAVLSCRKKKINNPHVSFFPFPRDSDRCKQWVKNIGRNDLINKSAEFMHKTLVLCSSHFDDDQFMNAAFRKRLVWDAVPTSKAESTASPGRPRGRPPKSLSPIKSNSGTPISVKQISSMNPPLEIELIKIPECPREETLTPRVVSVHSLAPFNKNTTPIRPKPAFIQPIKPRMAVTPQNIAQGPSTSAIRPQRNPTPLSVLRPQISPICTPVSVRVQGPPIPANLVTIRPQQGLPTREQRPPDMSPEALLKCLSKYIREPCITLLDIFIQKSRLRTGWKKWAKKIVLILYLHFPHVYLQLSKLFKLPSIKSLRKWQSKKIFAPGVDNSYLAAFHDIEFCENFKDGRKFFEEKVCILIIRQVHLSPHLTYDKQKGIVLGLEDFGIAGRSKYPATRALVLTVNGLLSNWQFPLGYFPVSKSLTIPMCSSLLFESLHQLETLGLLTKLIIFSDHKKHHELMDFLNVTVAKPFIQFRSRRLMVMLNPIGLLKRFRHKFRKSDLEMGPDKASWQHIVDFYNMDSKLEIRLVPQLTAKHVESPAFAPLPTRYVTDLFEYKLAAGIMLYSNCGRLPPEAANTAEVIHLMHQLLDCFSGVKNRPSSDRPLRSAICIGSPHLRFLSDFLLKIRNWFFVDCPGTDPALRGWHLTIAALMQLWFDTQKFSRQTFLRTTYFRTQTKQMRKIFCKVSKDQMTCSAISQKLNEVVVHSCFIVPKKQKRPKQNPSYFLQLLTKLRQALCSAPSVPDKSTGVPTALEIAKKPAFPSVNVMSFVAGYFAHYLFKNHSCMICKNHWIQKCPTDTGAVELFAVWLRKLTQGPVLEDDKICVPTELFMTTMEKCERLFMRCFPRLFHMNRLLSRISRYMMRRLKVHLKKMCRGMRKTFLKSFIEMRISQSLESVNEDLKAKKLKPRSKLFSAKRIKL